MARMVQCVYLKKEAPGLDFSPYPGELGKRIYDNVSKEAFEAWKRHDPKVINRLAREVIEAQQAGAEVALVIGGGNIFRGAGLAAGGMDRVGGPSATAGLGRRAGGARHDPDAGWRAPFRLPLSSRGGGHVAGCV